MKRTSSKIVILYYLLLLFVLGIKAVSTVYSGTMLADHGKKIYQLEKTKSELDHRKSLLTKQIASNQSLNKLTEIANSGSYLEISDPIVINYNNSLASAL